MARADQAGDPYSFRCVRQEYILRSDKGMGTACFPWGEEVLGALEELQKPEPEPSVIQRLGEVLRNFLEECLRTLEGWGAHEEKILRAAESGRPVQLVFRFAAAELYCLPWELVALRSTGQHLGELPHCLVRYEWPGSTTAPRSSPTTGGGRLLFGWSAAGGEVPASAHLRALQQACADGPWSFDAEQDVLSHLSLTTLQEALEQAAASPRPVTALHLLCHGRRTQAGTTGLVWNPTSPGSAPAYIDGGTLRRILEPYRGSLRLVVLCACHSANPGEVGNALGSVAQALHRVGFEAVIASRLPLSTSGSSFLAEALHHALLQQGEPLHHAFLAARRRLARLAGFDWASLQLYSRDPGLRLVPSSSAHSQELPHAELSRRLEVELASLNALELREVSHAVGVTRSGSERNDGEVAAAMARLVLEGAMAGTLKVVRLLAPVLGARKARKLLDLMAPLWVRSEAAGQIPEIAARHAPSWSVGLNGKYVPTFTSRMYVHRAYWPEPPHDVIRVAGGWGEDYVGHVRKQLLEHVRIDRNLATEEEAEDYLRFTEERIFVTLPPPLPDTEALEALRMAFANVTFILGTGESHPAEGTELPARVELLPRLDVLEERTAWQGYAEAIGAIRKYP